MHTEKEPLYTDSQLVWDVINEAIALREYATAEERARINFEYLDGGSTQRCIYGQATGHCHSQRAIDLIQKCAPRYFTAYAISYLNPGVQRLINNANGVHVSDFAKTRLAFRVSGNGSNFHYSAIEVFITLKAQYPAQVKSLTDYLRGDTDELDVYIF